MKHLNQNSKSSKLFSTPLEKTTLITLIVELIIILLVLAGLAITYFIIFNSRLQPKFRQRFLEDDYAFSSKYRRLVAPIGLENKTDALSIISTAYVDIFPDVKAAFMLFLIMGAITLATIAISFVGLFQKRSYYLIPRLIGQIFSIIGFIGSVAMFSVCYENIEAREEERGDGYENGAHVAKAVFLVYTIFSCFGLLIEIGAFGILYKCMMYLKKAGDQGIN